jgi:hypothetical protein
MEMLTHHFPHTLTFTHHSFFYNMGVFKKTAHWLGQAYTGTYDQTLNKPLKTHKHIIKSKSV